MFTLRHNALWPETPQRMYRLSFGDFAYDATGIQPEARKGLDLRLFYYYRSVHHIVIHVVIVISPGVVNVYSHV